MAATNQPSLPFEAPPPPIVFARHPRARRYVIRVALDGAVRVTIPRWGSKREAAAFAATQQPWIERQQRRMEAERLQRSASGSLLPIGQAAADQSGLRELRVRARRELPARLLELAAQHGLVVWRISVRNQRTRWGSCSRRGHICLNWRLIAMPPGVRDYVMLHELMHLKRMDHSPTFWKLVAAVCPEYESARRWLRAHRL